MALLLFGALRPLNRKKEILPARRNRKNKGIKADGTAFGYQNAFVSTSFDVEKWATRMGYDDLKLQEMAERGVLQKIIRAGKKGVQKIWYNPKSGWDRVTSKRTGALAIKVGMRLELDYWGTPRPCTILQLVDNRVIQAKTKKTDGYYALQIGAGLKKLKRVTKPMMGHYAKAGVAPAQKLVEFRVSSDAILPPGTKIYAEHFTTGQFVDVKAKSKGKGFSGAMKRWGFSGGPATHGHSVTHRALGATGARQDPGRVFPGKKMHGRMGGDMIAVRNLRVLKINTEDQMLWVTGCVPGPKGAWVEVRDALWIQHNRPPPFPTFWRKPNLKLPRFLHWRFKDPFKETRETDWEQKAAEQMATLRAIQASAEGEEGEGEEGAGLIPGAEGTTGATGTGAPGGGGAGGASA